eukprot:COSAG02_NODE_1140_length_14275_cov_154.904557_3_plen_50_part_00
MVSACGLHQWTPPVCRSHRNHPEEPEVDTGTPSLLVVNGAPTSPPIETD